MPPKSAKRKGSKGKTVVVVKTASSSKKKGKKKKKNRKDKGGKASVVVVREPQIRRTAVTGPYKSILASVVLPMTNAARFSVDYNADRTVLGRPFRVLPFDVTKDLALGGKVPYFGGGSMAAAVSRDPLTAMLTIERNYLGQPWGYRFWFSTIARIDATHTETVLKQTYTVFPEQDWANWVYKKDRYIGDPGKWHPFGDVSFVRTIAGDLSKRFTWMDGHTGLRWNFWSDDEAINLVTATGTIAVYMYNGVDATHSLDVNYNNTSVTIWIPDEAGFYTFKHKGSANVYVSVEHFEANMPACVLSHRPIPGLLDRLTLTGVKINGASLMMTPDSAQLAKGGLAVGLQLDPSMRVESLFLNASGRKATSVPLELRGHVQMDFRQGIYGWLRPTGANSFKKDRPMRYNLDFTVTDAGAANAYGLGNYISYIDTADGWLYLGADTPIGLDGAAVAGQELYPGGLMHLTYAWSVEYTSNDIWLNPVSAPRVRIVDLDDALERAVRDIPQFTSNAMHIRDLIKWIRTEAREIGTGMTSFVNKFGPIMQKGLKDALDFGGSLGAALAGET